MRILFITEDVPVAALGGAGRHAVVLANALIDAGHEVELLGRSSRSGGNGGDNGFRGCMHRDIDLSGTGWQEHRFGAFLPYRRHHVARRIWAAAQKLGVSGFDVVHYHGHVTELGAVVPPDVNFVHTIHDQGSECLRMTRYLSDATAPGGGRICNESSPSACARCATPRPGRLQAGLSAAAVVAHREAAFTSFSRHKVIFVSDFLRRRFLQHTGRSADPLRAHVVHNFVGMAELQAAAASGPDGGRQARPRVLLVGRVDTYKGFTEFFDHVSDELLARYEFRLIGDGPDMPRFLQRHGGRDIQRLGFLAPEAVARETAQADACVVPSLCEESCATTVLEALSLGRPVWALGQGGTPELARYGRPGAALHLFDDLPSLVADLGAAVIRGQIAELSDACSVQQRLPTILEVYAEARA